jgi:hypothetical protein
MQLKLKNIKSDTPAEYAFIGSIFTTWGSTIGAYGLTSSNTIVGYVGLACAIIGVTITIFANKKKLEQPNTTKNGTNNNKETSN